MPQFNTTESNLDSLEELYMSYDSVLNYISDAIEAYKGLFITKPQQYKLDTHIALLNTKSSVDSLLKELIAIKTQENVSLEFIKHVKERAFTLSGYSSLAGSKIEGGDPDEPLHVSLWKFLDASIQYQDPHALTKLPEIDRESKRVRHRKQSVQQKYPLILSAYYNCMHQQPMSVAFNRTSNNTSYISPPEQNSQRLANVR